LLLQRSARQGTFSSAPACEHGPQRARPASEHRPAWPRKSLDVACLGATGSHGVFLVPTLSLPTACIASRRATPQHSPVSRAMTPAIAALALLFATLVPGCGKPRHASSPSEDEGSCPELSTPSAIATARFGVDPTLDEELRQIALAAHELDRRATSLETEAGEACDAIVRALPQAPPSSTSRRERGWSFASQLPWK
jgi:hypothetical protein